MKERASFTFDKDTLIFIDKLVKSGEFRNRSHLVENAILLLNNNIFNKNNSEMKFKKNITNNLINQEKEGLKKLKEYILSN